MPDLWSPELSWIREIADILIVAFLFYHLFLLVRGTRAAQMFLGLVVLLFLSALADLLHLTALNWLLTSLRTVWVVGFLILFQPELRKGLSQIGYTGIFRRLLHLQETSHLSEIEDALAFLSRRGLGAILVIERNDSLRSYAETGTLLEANLSAELLETIFTPPSPLHDGAVIVRGNVIVSAGCILPLSQTPSLDRTLGTRHRAVIGISEETDALAIAVSEETRQISIADGGRMVRNIDPTSLKGILSQFGPGREEREERDDKDEREEGEDPAPPRPPKARFDEVDTGT
ncbi:MAG: TIGR00159 family protein [Candidatus Eisenbacteria bacterium]|nr:TIGR00159 family protein [Candidatus Eisenbacteria bacterium]